MYEHDKKFRNSTFERAYPAQETTISHIKLMFESLYYETKVLSAMKRYLQNYIDSCHKESERHAAYPEHITAHFNNVENITVNSDSITHRRKNGREEDCQE